ncbi:MAG: methylmalonyl-CoA mutase subunit beta [Phyllobacterium sp.]
MDPRIVKDAVFDPVDHDRWVKLAEKALKGAEFENTLASHTDDGIRIDPLYPRRKDAPLLPRVKADAPWHMIQRVDDPDTARAHAQLLDDLENGATGLTLVFEGAPNAYGYGLPARPETLAEVLDGVHLDMIHLRIDAHPNSRACADWMADYLQQRQIDPANLSFSLGIDHSAVLASTGRLRMSINALRASLPQSLSVFFSSELPGVFLEADSRPYHNAGATEAQELGATLAIAIGHLRMFDEARMPSVYAAPHIGFALSVDQDQFVSIAKIRALRRLWQSAQEACGFTPTPARIHVETSMRMMTAKDPETNILRSTIAVFAAAVGGADSICVLPHTQPLGLPDAFARRLARNTQHVLCDESNLGFVADAGSGSGGIEALTDALCEAGWVEFQKLETDGGIMESLVGGHLQDRILRARDRRTEDYRSGKRSIIGTTLYPAKQERPVTLLEARHMPVPTDGTVHCEPLPIQRIDETLN